MGSISSQPSPPLSRFDVFQLLRDVVAVAGSGAWPDDVDVTVLLDTPDVGLLVNRLRACKTQ